MSTCVRPNLGLPQLCKAQTTTQAHLQKCFLKILMLSLSYNKKFQVSLHQRYLSHVAYKDVFFFPVSIMEDHITTCVPQFLINLLVNILLTISV